MERLDKRNVKSFIIKIILSFILLLFAVYPSISTVEVKAEDKTAHIVIEHSTNRILYKYNAFQKMYPASTTKILTAITVLENCDTESVVEIPSIAVGIEGSSIYLKAGEKYKVIDASSYPDAPDAYVLIAQQEAEKIVEMCKSIENIK